MTTLVLLTSASVVVVLVSVVVHQRRRIDELEREASARHGGNTRRTSLISIEIRNHAEVAKARNFLARPLAAVTPGILRSIVNRETTKMLRTELAANGVDADVRLRRVRGPDRPAVLDADEIVEVDVEDEGDDEEEVATDGLGAVSSTDTRVD